jgi:hypothetical protein
MLPTGSPQVVDVTTGIDVLEAQSLVKVPVQQKVSAFRSIHFRRL